MSERDILTAAAILTGALPMPDDGPPSGTIGYPTAMQVAVELTLAGIPHRFDPMSSKMPLTATLSIHFRTDPRIVGGKVRHFPTAYIERKDTAGNHHLYGPCKRLSYDGFWQFLNRAMEDDRNHLAEYTAIDPYAREAA